MPAGWYLRTDTVWAFVIEFGGEFEGVEIMKKYLLANFDFFPKLRTAVDPLNKARIGAKLWENAFRTICNFSFFDAHKKRLINFCKHFRGRFQKSEVLEGLRIFNPRWQMRRQKLLPVVRLFLGRLPWRRGKRFNMC